MYRQFHNYDGVIFLYYHVFDLNYHLPINTETFLFEFIHFRWTGFYRPYSVSDFPVSVTNRIKTYTSENGEMVFPNVFDRFHHYFHHSLKKPHILYNLVKTIINKKIGAKYPPNVLQITHYYHYEKTRLKYSSTCILNYSS
jgi:hypothetical protein